MGIAYRLRQLRANLNAGPLDGEARREIATILSPAEMELFARYTFADQWHAWRVLRALADEGYNHPDLQTAALLHDIGKTRYPLTIRDRIAIVVGGGLFPRRALAWGNGSVQGWRRPFVIKAMHPAWGAEMARAAGSRAMVVELIARHQDAVDAAAGDASESDGLLAQLQWADDRS